MRTRYLVIGHSIGAVGATKTPLLRLKGWLPRKVEFLPYHCGTLLIGNNLGALIFGVGHFAGNINKMRPSSEVYRGSLLEYKINPVEEGS